MEGKVKHLLSLQAVRERSRIVFEAAKCGKLSHFDFHEDRMEAAANYVTDIIKRDFGPDKFDSIPPHGRWQHFEVGNVPRVTSLLKSWEDEGCDKTECTRRLIDLFFVSVLLDAGAGDVWEFKEPATGFKCARSEGLAVASLYMFTDGRFSTPGSGVKCSVTSAGLQQLSTESLSEGLQVTKENLIPGLESRAALLRSLGASLAVSSEAFGNEGRPSDLLDYMMKSSDAGMTLDVEILWNQLQSILIRVWPKSRTSLGGMALGDAWPLKVLQNIRHGDDTESIQPFHKLTQWLTYSLMVPFGRILGFTWTNVNTLTGLPEYRNGGLFVDMGVLTLKEPSLARGLKLSSESLPMFEAGDDVIVEWRAMTVTLLDMVYEMILSRMTVEGKTFHLSMAQVLESGTWKAGRELAAKYRPETKSSPIVILSDGTVF